MLKQSLQLHVHKLLLGGATQTQEAHWSKVWIQVWLYWPGEPCRLPTCTFSRTVTQQGIGLPNGYRYPLDKSRPV